MSTPRPLDGIRIVDFTRFLAGPFATTMLGDMGADVVKVERPQDGDGTRDLDRVFEPGLSSYYLGLNRSKRAIAVDFRTDEGLHVVRKLIATADVVIENFRPEVMPGLGLGYEDVRELNPDLVYCSISSFGPTGPLRTKAGMDLVVQAMGGVMGLTGEAGRDPVRVGVPVGDFVGAYQAVCGIMFALMAREKSHGGQKVDVALIDGQISMLANYLPGFEATGNPSGPVGVGHPQLAPYQPFETADGRLIIACLTEEFWRRMCRVIGREDLMEDPRFVHNADRVAHRDELIAVLAPIFATHATAELSEMLDVADVPSAPIHTLADLFAHPQVRHNDMIMQLNHPVAGPYKAAGFPVKLRGTPARVDQGAPMLGEHTQQLLEELGLSPSELESLSERGIIGHSSSEVPAGSTT